MTEATAENLRLITDAYLDFFLAKQRQTKAEVSLKRAKTGPTFADWQDRITKATTEFEDQNARYMDRWIVDIYEPQVIAFEQMRDEVDTLFQELPEGPLRERTEELRRRIHESIIRRQGFLLTLMKQLDIPILKYLSIPPGLGEKRGIEYTTELKAILEQADESLRSLSEQTSGSVKTEPLPVEVLVTPEPKVEEAEPVSLAVPTKAEPQQLDVPVTAVAQEQPVEPVKLDVPVEAPEQQVDVPVKAVAKEVPVETTEVSIPVEAAEQQVDVPVRAVAKEVPAEITEVGVPIEAESQQVDVPVRVVAQAIPAEPVGATAQQIRTEKVIIKEAEPQVVHHHTVTYVYDNSIRYHPRVGDDLVGPRFPA